MKASFASAIALVSVQAANTSSNYYGAPADRGYGESSYDGYVPYHTTKTAAPTSGAAWSDYTELSLDMYKNDLLHDSKNLWAVVFVTQGCPSCKTLLKDFDSVTSNLAGRKIKFTYVDIDTDEGKVLQDEYTHGINLQYAPTIVLYGSDKLAPVEYDGDYELAPINTFLTDYCDNNGYLAGDHVVAKLGLASTQDYRGDVELDGYGRSPQEKNYRDYRPASSFTDSYSSQPQSTYQQARRYGAPKAQRGYGQQRQVQEKRVYNRAPERQSYQAPRSYEAAPKRFTANGRQQRSYQAQRPTYRQNNSYNRAPQYSQRTQYKAPQRSYQEPKSDYSRFATSYRDVDSKDQRSYRAPKSDYNRVDLTSQFDSYKSPQVSYDLPSQYGYSGQQVQQQRSYNGPPKKSEIGRRPSFQKLDRNAGKPQRPTKNFSAPKRGGPSLGGKPSGPDFGRGFSAPSKRGPSKQVSYNAAPQRGYGAPQKGYRTQASAPQYGRQSYGYGRGGAY